MFQKSSNKIVFTKPKIINPKKELSIDDIIDLIKSNKADLALDKIARELAPKDRLKICSDIVKNSRFKAFKFASESFIRVIDRYLENGDKYNIRNYRDNLCEDFTDECYSNFVMFRRAAISDILFNDVNYFLEALHIFMNTHVVLDGVEYEEYYKKITIQLAEALWKEKATALKVLYGQ